jgi:hypothetical protein
MGSFWGAAVVVWGWLRQAKAAAPASASSKSNTARPPPHSQGLRIDSIGIFNEQNAFSVPRWI